MIETFDYWRSELLERRQDIVDMIIESIGPDCEKDLMRWKGMLEENDYILDSLRRFIKYHECEKYLIVNEDKDMCVVCGWEKE